MKRLYLAAKRLADGLQRILDTGGEGFANADEAVRVAIIAQDFSEHPWRFPMGIQSFGIGVQVGPAVGQQSYWLLRNPAQSRLLVRVRRLILSNFTNADGEVIWGTMPSDATFPANNSRGSVRDTRQPFSTGGIPGVSAATWGSGAQAGAIGVAAERMFLKGPGASAQYVVLPVEYTLRPDTGFFVNGMAAQNGFTIAVTWEEIPAEAGELNYPTVGPLGQA